MKNKIQSTQNKCVWWPRGATVKFKNKNKNKKQKRKQKRK